MLRALTDSEEQKHLGMLQRRLAEAVAAGAHVDRQDVIEDLLALAQHSTNSEMHERVFATIAASTAPARAADQRAAPVVYQ